MTVPVATAHSTTHPRVRLGLAGLMAAVAVEWAGATAILPVLPLLLRHRGVPVAYIGLTMAAFLGASFVTQYPLGRFADRVGRGRLLQLSLWLYALATVGFLLGGPVWLTIALRAAQGAAAGGADVAAQALVVDLVPARRHGRAYAMLSAAQMGGMVIGPIAGSLLAQLSVSLLFVVGASAAVVAAVVLRATLPRRRQVRTGIAPARWAPDWRVLRGVLAISAGGGLLLGVYESDWTLLMHSRGASGWEIGFSFTLYAIPLVLLSWPAGWLADHGNRRWLAASALAAAAGCAAIYPFLPSAGLLMALSAVEATLSAAGYPATLSLLARATGPGSAGRGQGLYASVQTGAAALGAAAGGVLFSWGAAVPFVVSGLLALGLVGLLPWLWHGVGSERRPAATEMVGSTALAALAAPALPARAARFGHGRLCSCASGTQRPGSQIAAGRRRAVTRTPGP
ncbi:MAG TPA: MFS transporter [Verrucomicrobiae bacterium]|nr:MFS transporter [Verrucomicrobiae bacterium]